MRPTAHSIVRKPRGDMVAPPFLLYCLDKFLFCLDKFYFVWTRHKLSGQFLSCLDKIKFVQTR